MSPNGEETENEKQKERKTQETEKSEKIQRNREDYIKVLLDANLAKSFAPHTINVLILSKIFVDRWHIYHTSAQQIEVCQVGARN